jgi:hypothetical protein
MEGPAVMHKVWYRKFKPNYKYITHVDHLFPISIKGMKIDFDWFSLTEEGYLSIKEGYAWDGPSGPTFDTKSSIRASLIHDVLYQMLRERMLPAKYREMADNELFRVCIEDGMWKWRARLWYRAVRKAAGYAAKPRKKEKVYVAPC